MSFNYQEFVEAVKTEQERRQALKEKRRPYHYWKVRGDDRPPPEEHWCTYCAGYFGVPHEGLHKDRGDCRFLYRALQGDRQCACLDCVVAENYRA